MPKSITRTSNRTGTAPSSAYKIENAFSRIQRCRPPKSRTNGCRSSFPDLPSPDTNAHAVEDIYRQVLMAVTIPHRIASCQVPPQPRGASSKPADPSDKGARSNSGQGLVSVVLVECKSYLQAWKNHKMFRPRHLVERNGSPQASNEGL
jgi:hypothetical protein